jgi:hypothetical protein
MRLLLPALMLAAAPATARDPILSLPVDCTLGDDCFILQYADADPGRGAADYTCGPMSYDGHKGTDFAVPSFAAMAEGVDVIAAAPGVVRGQRDGMPDTGADDTPAELLTGRECGNGVVIDHGGGWETQYCHMKQGSITVEAGQRVPMGKVLGQIGFSGRTQYPHLHLAVREDGRVVDPFNTDELAVCGEDDGPEDDLWSDSPPYRGGGLVAVGVSPGVPEYDAIKAGREGVESLPPDAAALVAWGFAFGGQAGDALEITIKRPDGSKMVEGRQAVERQQVLFFRAAGRRQPDGGWSPGEYGISVSHWRGDTLLDQRDTTVTVRE